MNMFYDILFEVYNAHCTYIVGAFWRHLLLDIPTNENNTNVLGKTEYVTPTYILLFYWAQQVTFLPVQTAVPALKLQSSMYLCPSC